MSVIASLPLWAYLASLGGVGGLVFLEYRSIRLPEWVKTAVTAAIALSLLLTGNYFNFVVMAAVFIVMSRPFKSEKVNGMDSKICASMCGIYPLAAACGILVSLLYLLCGEENKTPSFLYLFSAGYAVVAGITIVLLMIG